MLLICLFLQQDNLLLHLLCPPPTLTASPAGGYVSCEWLLVARICALRSKWIEPTVWAPHAGTLSNIKVENACRVIDSVPRISKLLNPICKEFVTLQFSVWWGDTKAIQLKKQHVLKANRQPTIVGITPQPSASKRREDQSSEPFELRSAVGQARISAKSASVFRAWPSFNVKLKLSRCLILLSRRDMESIHKQPSIEHCDAPQTSTRAYECHLSSSFCPASRHGRSTSHDRQFRFARCCSPFLCASAACQQGLLSHT